MTSFASRIVALYRVQVSMLGLLALGENDNAVPAAVDGRGALWTRDALSSDIRDGVTVFDIFSTPAAATAPSATVAAPGSPRRNVLRSLSGSISGVAAAQGMLTIVVRDGASGVGAIRWSVNVGPVLIGESQVFSFDNLYIAASNNTALTIEFTAAPAAGNFASIAGSGTIVGE
jgi:hypothetical protein